MAFLDFRLKAASIAVDSLSIKLLLTKSNPIGGSLYSISDLLNPLSKNKILETLCSDFVARSSLWGSALGLSLVCLPGKKFCRAWLSSLLLLEIRLEA